MSIRRPVVRVLGTMITFALAAAPAAYAADASPSPFLFGDWGGTRTQLAEEGLDFQFSWVNELAHNYSGGTQELTRSTGQFGLGATANLAKLWGWQGATFQIFITDRNGRDLGTDAHIGNNQLIQEVYGRGQTWWLTQFSLQQTFFDDKLSVKGGRLPISADFGYGDCDFENLTFCGPPPGNLQGRYWLNSPSSVWAINVRYQTSIDSYVKLGAYQQNATYTDNSWAVHNAWKLGNPSGTHGVVAPVEFGWTPAIQGLPGIYKFGAWIATGGGDDLYLNTDGMSRALYGGDPRHRNNSYGGYISAKQQITGEAGGRGATLVFNLTKADRNTAQTNGQIALAVQYRGAFNRPDDVIGFAIGATKTSGYYGDYARDYNASHAGAHLILGGGYEKVGELYYSWSPLPSLAIRPNVQYVANPGGSSDNHNALVLGLKSVVTF